jgi:hypothetical protein
MVVYFTFGCFASRRPCKCLMIFFVHVKTILLQNSFRIQSFVIEWFSHAQKTVVMHMS